MHEIVRQRVRQAIDERIFPACVVGWIDGNGSENIVAEGSMTYEDLTPVTRESIFDIASITKAIPGSCALMQLVDEGKLSLDDRLVEFVPEFGNLPGKGDVRIRHLLTYTLNLQVPAMSSLKNLRAPELLRFVIEAPLKNTPGSSFFYTNSTALFFGLVVRKVCGMTLDAYAQEHFFDPLGMGRTTFHPERFSQDEIVPTEIDEWRGGLVRGVVHDESSYILREHYIGGTAGLFSTVPDLLRFARMLLSGGVQRGVRYFSPEMIREMYTNQLGAIGASAGLGWELSDETRMGRYAPELFGKTGFTGCVILINPSKRRALVILSNRVYPKRPNDAGSGINHVRRDIADIIFA